MRHNVNNKKAIRVLLTIDTLKDFIVSKTDGFIEEYVGNNIIALKVKKNLLFTTKDIYSQITVDSDLYNSYLKLAYTVAIDYINKL